jgi:hypothetical protein
MMVIGTACERGHAQPSWSLIVAAAPSVQLGNGGSKLCPPMNVFFLHTTVCRMLLVIVSVGSGHHEEMSWMRLNQQTPMPHSAGGQKPKVKVAVSLVPGDGSLSRHGDREHSSVSFSSHKGSDSTMRALASGPH